MKNVFILIIGVLLIFTSSSFGVSYGKKFIYYPKMPIFLGNTTKSQILKFFGEPYESKSFTNKDGVFERLYYLFMSSSGFLGLGETRGRFFNLEFKESKLNGYSYISNFSEEGAELDEEMYKKISVGVSKDSIVKILGKPTGKSFCPSYLTYFNEICEDSNNCKEIWLWSNISSPIFLDLRMMITEQLFIMFDNNGLVINIKRTNPDSAKDLQ